jgi:hypothetical protein
MDVYPMEQGNESLFVTPDPGCMDIGIASKILLYRHCKVGGFKTEGRDLEKTQR